MSLQTCLSSFCGKQDVLKSCFHLLNESLMFWSSLTFILWMEKKEKTLCFKEERMSGLEQHEGILPKGHHFIIMNNLFIPQEFAFMTKKASKCPYTEPLNTVS